MQYFPPPSVFLLVVTLHRADIIWLFEPDSSYLVRYQVVKQEERLLQVARNFENQVKEHV